MNPFDYVNAILQNKKQMIVDEITEKDYAPFLVNRSLSYHKDCIMYANEMNRRHFLDKKLQNDFLLNTVRSQKRPFAKWIKVEKNDASDPVIRYLPNGGSSITLIGLLFTEFETGTYDPSMNTVLSKSEISTVYSQCGGNDFFLSSPGPDPRSR